MVCTRDDFAIWHFSITFLENYAFKAAIRPKGY